MEENTLISALGGMILSLENRSDQPSWLKDFLVEIKSTLELQEAKIVQYEQQVNSLKESMEYACEMISVGENSKANDKLCEALIIPYNHFE